MRMEKSTKNGDLGERTRRKSPLVVAAGFEPAIAWMKTMCPRPLDDATTFLL